MEEEEQVDEGASTPGRVGKVDKEEDLTSEQAGSHGGTAGNC